MNGEAAAQCFVKANSTPSTGRRFGKDTVAVDKRLHPPDRRTGADIELIGRFVAPELLPSRSIRPDFSPISRYSVH